MIREHIVISTAHGSPYDRGSADSYYRRGRTPHWYPNGTGNWPRIEAKNMTPDEIEAYNAGYDDNEDEGNFKDWG
jgi:hypothetical protein